MKLSEEMEALWGKQVMTKPEYQILIEKAEALEKRVKELGKLFAEYRSSEGCSCCEDTDTHNEIEQNLGELLNVPRDKYNSGYDWDKLLTPTGGGE